MHFPKSWVSTWTVRMQFVTIRAPRQFLGRPATSAGVERMFSKAGKLHDDMKKGQDDDSLEHAMLAAANCV